MSIQLGGPKKPQNLEKAKVILCLFLLAFSNIATFSQTLSRAPSQGRGESFYYRMTQLLPTIDMGHNLFDVMTKAGYQNVVVDVGPTNEAVTMSQVDRHMNTLLSLIHI